MAELGKVIKGMECCSQSDNYSRKPCKECPYNHEWRDDQGIVHLCKITQLRKDALTLLKAQEPIEPEADVDTWVCSKCGHRLEHQEMLGTNILFDERYSYCPGCGRAVKWK